MLVWLLINEVNITQINSHKVQNFYDTSYMRYLKKGTNELIYKAEIVLQKWKTNLWLPGGKGGGINWKIEIDAYTLLYIK